MRLLWLADRLRSVGLTVSEYPGWRTRGVAFRAPPLVVVGHHTATSAQAIGDFPTLRLLVEGRSDLSGPLSQVGISRSGVVHVLASGKANHAGKGAWAGVTSSSLTVGIEVEHPGTGPWSSVQLRAFDLTAAALLAGLDRPPSAYCGHREWARPAGRKVDPNIDLTAQRTRIAALLTPSTSEEDDMQYRAIRRVPDGAIALTAANYFRHVSGEELDAAMAAGLTQSPSDEVNAVEWDRVRALALGSDR